MIFDICHLNSCRRLQGWDQAWRYLTYSLVHHDWPHLLANLFLFILLGINLQAVNSFRWVFPLYLTGVRLLGKPSNKKMLFV